MNELPRLVVLISGNGSNLQAVLDACADGYLPAKVVLVVSNRSEAYGLERAARAGVPTKVYPKSLHPDRVAYDTGLARLVADSKPDWIVLAGWMRVLSSAFLNEFPGKVINLHPALPGMFPGTHAIERAFDAYTQGQIQETGVMIHLVPDEGVDQGPVLAQEIVSITPNDSLETLEHRVHSTEHRLLVETLRMVIQNNRSGHTEVDSE